MKQAQALALLKAGHNVFLTGQAGAGKTYVLNQFIAFLRANHIPVAITASTGIAATHMNGMTIHSWAGIGIKDKLEDHELRALGKKDALVERLKTVSVLIIDEVSMLHARQLDLVDTVLRHFRKNDTPFGGVQVVFSGDFFQLPPIGEKGETTKEKFAFMSKAWIALANSKIDDSPAIKVCYLSEQHRQQDDNDNGLSLNQILNQVRSQAVTPQAVQALLATNNNALDIDRVRLYTHNAKVSEINADELANIKGKSYEYEAVGTGDEKLLETLKKGVLAYETLTLKKGAKVMFVKNNPNDDVYNGTLGEVVKFVPVNDNGTSVDYPIVRLANGKELLVGYESWSIDDEDGTPLASFAQIPLCLAWAMTVHKSQGMTIDAAEIDLSKTFERGQGYVALSRVKSLAGLKLLGLNDKSLLLDDFAQVADRRFLQLSAECSHWIDTHQAELDTQQTNFVKQNALRYSAELSHLATKKPATPAPPTKNSFTQDILNQIITQITTQKSLQTIANHIGFAKMTVIRHCGELLAEQRLNLSDLNYLMPNDDIIAQVKTTLHTLDERGELESPPKINPIANELGGKVSHQDIALALLKLKQQ